MGLGVWGSMCSGGWHQAAIVSDPFGTVLIDDPTPFLLRRDKWRIDELFDPFRVGWCGGGSVPEADTSG